MINFLFNIWKKRQNPGLVPTIIIDFDNLTKTMVKKFRRENMCGGQNQQTLDAWKKLLDAFKATGCKLVFIAGANIQKDKIDNWLSKRNTQFNKNFKFYEAISSERNNFNAAINLFPNYPLGFALHGMAALAQSYGELQFSVKREADVEIVHQAGHHRAMAIISDDSDFLIFK